MKGMKEAVLRRTISLACGIERYEMSKKTLLPFTRMSAHLWIRVWLTVGWPQFTRGDVLVDTYTSKIYVVKSMDLQLLECTIWTWDGDNEAMVESDKYPDWWLRVFSTDSISYVQTRNWGALHTMPLQQLCKTLDQRMMGWRVRHFSALDLACCFNEMESCRIILGRLKDTTGFLCPRRSRDTFMWACVDDSVDCASLLLVHGTGVSLIAETSINPNMLISAARFDATKIVNMLIKAGADVNAVDNNVCVMLCYVRIKCGVGTKCTSLGVAPWTCRCRELVSESGCQRKCRRRRGTCDVMLCAY